MVTIDLISSLIGESESNVKLSRGYEQTCTHNHLTYREAELTLECKHCKKHLNPVEVLKRVLRNRQVAEERIRKSDEAMKELAKRNRTKCEHCSNMTRIEKGESWKNWF